MKTNIIRNSVASSLAVICMTACRSAPVTELSSSANPSEEVVRLADDLHAAQGDNVDVLARDKYLKSMQSLERAKEGLANGKKQEQIIDDLRFGREALAEARDRARSKGTSASGLLESRQRAIRAGASQLPALQKDWVELDEDVAKDANHTQGISAERAEGFQSRYVEFEKQTIIEAQLGDAKARVRGARNQDAAKRAPMALRNAEMSVKNAESLIGSNVSNPTGFDQAVVQANNETQFLSDVMEIMVSQGKTMTEAAATQAVLQKRQISNLKKNLSTAEVRASDSQSQTNVLRRRLADNQQRLGDAQASVAMQKAIEQSRQKFLPEEAEAYQQGDSLLIRLKAIKFRSGRSELPTESLMLLSKVSDIAKSLGAGEIVVQGHTDSIGTRSSNKSLSERRALAVSMYFKANGLEGRKIVSEGQGFEHPIATNKSIAGRAQNRRVDVIITPTGERSIRQ
jgi:OmpA-OmpF porin, OOP family